MHFTTFLTSTIIALAVAVAATRPPVNTANGIVSLADMKAWVESQDTSDITLIGDPFGPQAAEKITVTYCSTISGNVCTGPCTVATGSGICIRARGTNCLFATGQVSFCDNESCGGSCHQFNSCGTRLHGGFCATPGTQSIGIPAGA